MLINVCCLWGVPNWEQKGIKVFRKCKSSIQSGGIYSVIPNFISLVLLPQS